MLIVQLLICYERVNKMLTFHRFVGLCLRFADDFETSLDDWKPDVSDSSIMNLCMVSEGTYEVCSRTIAQKQDKSGNKIRILL